MARVTDAEVRAIMEQDQIIVSDLTPFITAADIVIDDHAAIAALSDATTKEISRWLAAHFTSIMDKRVASEKAGSVSQDFQYKLGLNFQVTMYGQQAMMLDSSGTLSRLNKADGASAGTINTMTYSQE